MLMAEEGVGTGDSCLILLKLSGHSEEPLCLCWLVCALLLLPRKVILKEPENRDG